ncbi:MAG TPA: response regulator transcription factor, partial [Gemmatimonadaceae bacterium]|nr:response regulator transcription factor [Gemmatimonadaceae bacterium]
TPEDTMLRDTGSAPSHRETVADVGAALSTHIYARRGVAASVDGIRVLLVDDHALVRTGIKAMLSGARDLTIIGEASNGREALELAARLTPDVVVMDLDMPDGDGESATRALVALPHPPRVLILTMHDERERLLDLLHAGAAGYLAKDASSHDLLDAVRVVAAGDTYVRPAVARRLAASEPATMAASRSARAVYDALSEREQVVLRLVAQGMSGTEIGDHLGISAKTVNTYRQRIHEKAGLATRVDFVRFAIDAELLDE